MASPEGVAALFVDRMDQDTQEEFAQVAAEAKPYRRGHLKVAEGMIKSHVENAFHVSGQSNVAGSGATSACTRKIDSQRE